MAQVIDWAERLYDAADGNLEGLLEMWHEHQNADAVEQRSAAPFDGERPESRSMRFADMDVAPDGWSFDGLLSVYDEPADLVSHIERFARGAYRKVLASGDNVPMLYHHNEDLPVLATTKGGTLSLKDDAKGLRVKADIAQHYVGEAARQLVKRGDITGMSPGFVAGRGNSKVEQRNGRIYRTITGLKKLLDVSLTWEPAYAGTTAELRSLRAPQLADDIDLLQRLLAGVAPQLEKRAQVEIEPESPPADVPDPEVTPDEEPAAPDDEEQRSGVESAQADAAARRRRLQMMGFSLPKA
jgi:HK97 family phage prohead protease